MQEVVSSKKVALRGVLFEVVVIKTKGRTEVGIISTDLLDNKQANFGMKELR